MNEATKLQSNHAVEPAGGLAALTATDFLARLTAGEITVQDYAAACADIVERLDNRIHAWAWFDRGRFLDHARAADAALHLWRRDNPGLPGRMYGVPVGVKDIYNTADMPTAHGSDLFAGYMPGNDARVVTDLKREGSIMAGKTVTAEFAVHTPGATRNPIDPERSVGTSSSGSAAAVATHMVPVALASQTAGSTIRPASYCGIYGFKPSFGLLPRTAMLKTTDTLDTVGMVARSVPDLRLMFDAMRVYGPNYPIVDREMSKPERLSIGDGPWRVGVVVGPKENFESAAVKQGIRRLADRLAANGCAVESYRLPAAFDRAHDVHQTIYTKALSYYFKLEWGRARGRFSPRLADMIEAGNRTPAEAYHAACAEQTRLAHLFDEEMGRFDVLLCPSTADEAPVGFDAPDPPDHNLIWTMCHAPVIGLPLLSGTTGLPAGAEIVSRRFNDYILLSFARFLDDVAR